MEDGDGSVRGIPLAAHPDHRADGRGLGRVEDGDPGRDGAPAHLSVAGPRPSWRAGLSPTVYVLGAISLFTDAASEMIAPLRVVFLVSVLGTPIPIAGLIEGLAEATSSLLKVVSGRMADRVPRRKPLIVLGYGVSNAAKPLLALATGWPHVLALLLLDRIGKGVRGSPRDALIADVTPSEFRGKAFGFHRAMDTFGAALGPAAALFILASVPQDLPGNPPSFLARLIAWGGIDRVMADVPELEPAMRTVFAWTALPGLLAVLVGVFFLREAPRLRRAVPAVSGERSLGRPFWLFTGAAVLFALANCSDAFFFLRAVTLDAWLEALPALYLGYNVVYAALATPLGALSDRYGRVPVLLAGYLAFALVYAGWAVARDGWHIWVLFGVYGVYAAATEGVARALVVDLAPRASRGAALGWFNGLTGFAALPANLLAGLVWVTWGPGAAFALGALLAALAALMLLAASSRLVPAPAR